MFKIAYNKMQITQGDTASFNVELDTPPNRDPYILSDEDQVLFIVTKKKIVIPMEDVETSEDVIFYKSGTVIKLEPKDTESLTPGTYYYHVRVKLKDSLYINTIIEPTEFKVSPCR